MICVPYIKNSPNMLFIPTIRAENIADKCTECVVWVNKDPFEWLQFESYLVRIFYLVLIYIVLWMTEQSFFFFFLRSVRFFKMHLFWFSSKVWSTRKKIWIYNWQILSHIIMMITKSMYHSEDNGREALWRLVAETKIIKWYSMLRESNKSKYHWNWFDSKFSPNLQHAFLK